MTWQAIETLRAHMEQWSYPELERHRPEWEAELPAALAALSVVEEALEAADGVMTQMDYETPHHTRLRAALARAREGIKP